MFTTQRSSLAGERDSLLVVVELSNSVDQPGPTSLLDSRERYRASRLVRVDDRRAFVAAHTLKRLALAAVTGLNPQSLEFYDDAYGKPHLAGQRGVFFNLSHTHGMVAFAYSRRGQVGVDVEFLGAEIYDHAAAALSLTPEEILLVEGAANRDHAFLLFWTAKEAAMKAEGKGMSMNMRDVHVANGTAATPSSHWSVRHYRPSERHVLAFARSELSSMEPACSAPPCLVMEEVSLWQWVKNGNPPPRERFACLEPFPGLSDLHQQR